MFETGPAYERHLSQYIECNKNGHNLELEQIKALSLGARCLASVRTSSEECLHHYKQPCQDSISFHVVPSVFEALEKTQTTPEREAAFCVSLQLR